MASLRAAIIAKCKSGIFDPGSGRGAWRKLVTACSSASCPLQLNRRRNAAKRGYRARIEESAHESRIDPPASISGARIAQFGGG